MKKAKVIVAMAVSLGREAWPGLILLLLAVVMAAVGGWLQAQPEWMERADIRSYNQGVAAYQAPAARGARTLEKAIALFEQTLVESQDPALKSLALYNLATISGQEALIAVRQMTQAYASQGGKGMEEDQSLLIARREIRQAMAKLADALRLDPANDEAKFNLELLEREMGGKEISGSRYAGGEVEKGY